MGFSASLEFSKGAIISVDESTFVKVTKLKLYYYKIRNGQCYPVKVEPIREDKYKFLLDIDAYLEFKDHQYFVRGYYYCRRRSDDLSPV